MKRALFSAVELLGDMVEITPALYTWKKLHPDYEIELRLQDEEHCKILNKIPDINVKLIPGDFDLVRNPPDKKEYDFFHHFSVAKASKISWNMDIHMSKGFAKVLGVETDFMYPIINDIKVARNFRNYIAIAPFAGSANKDTEDGGGERALPMSIWAGIIKLIITITKYDVVVLGHSKSPWGMWDTYVTDKVDSIALQNNNITSVEETMEVIASPSCQGVIAPDSGILHCVSALSQQLYKKEKRHIPTLAFLSTVVPTRVSYPFGINSNHLLAYRSYCGKISLSEAISKTRLFCDIISAIR